MDDLPRWISRCSAMTACGQVARSRSSMSYEDLGHMNVLQQDIRSAYQRIRPHVRRTPVIRVDAGDFGVTLGSPLALKLEFLQHTGSFKPRGAFNNLLSRGVPAAGVAAASGGNH